LADDAETGGDNRRRFPRLRESCNIRVRPLTGATLPDGVDGVDAMTVNISGGGLCYEGAEPIETGSFVAVELSLPEFPSPVLALARTAYCGSEGPPFEIGLEFWWVGWGDDSAQRAIAGFIKTELRSRDGS
jgi:hypothetical protein